MRTIIHRRRHTSPRITVRIPRRETFTLYQRRARSIQQRHPEASHEMLARLAFATNADYIAAINGCERFNLGPLFA